MLAPVREITIGVVRLAKGYSSKDHRLSLPPCLLPKCCEARAAFQLGLAGLKPGTGLAALRSMPLTVP
ncbi:hypothetical protein SCFA_890001 [anaerobic digester metagenome]|uniref:Uncharacterized protein n=1 Tax=anaerobic digester metagenome TaxID=1263854 RepID=A0A485M552_9ZZZZ